MNLKWATLLGGNIANGIKIHFPYRDISGRNHCKWDQLNQEPMYIHVRLKRGYESIHNKQQLQMLT
jgi:hypothetical protein